MSILNSQNFLSIFSNRKEINQVQCGDPIEPPISANTNDINNENDLLFKSQSEQIRFNNVNLNKFKNHKKKSSPNVNNHFLNQNNQSNFKNHFNKNYKSNNKHNANNSSSKKNKIISKINSIKKIQKNNSNFSNNKNNNNNNNNNNNFNSNNNNNNNNNFNTNINDNNNNNNNNFNINCIYNNNKFNNSTLKNTTSNRTYSLIDSNNCDILSSKRTSNALNSRRILNNNINVNNNFNIEKKQSLNEIISPINNPKITNYNNNNMNSNLQNNNNKIKKEIIKLNYSKFFSLLNYNSLFHLLNFLNNNEIKELLNINKHFRIFFNTILINVYYNKIINKLKKYKNFYEIIKKKIIFTKIKGKIKIDFQITIRFLMNLNHPLNMTILYAYNYNQENNNNNNNNNFLLNSNEINKSTISNSININNSTNFNMKNSKIVDFFSFDIFPSHENTNDTNENFLFPNIYMIREFTTFNLDTSLQKTYIQPILPFRQFDAGILSFQIYSPSKNFINPNSIQLTTKINTDYEKIINVKNSEINPRICQFEEHCVNLRNINFFKEKKSVIYQIKDIFGEYFKLIKILFEDIGFLVFKIYLKAYKVGELKNKKEIGINIKIKDKNDFVVNEIKKNDLLFENRNVFECRIDDILIFYFTHDL